MAVTRRYANNTYLNPSGRLNLADAAYTAPSNAWGPDNGTTADKSQALVLQSGAIELNGYAWSSAASLAGESGDPLKFSAPFASNPGGAPAGESGATFSTSLIRASARWKLSVASTDSTTQIALWDEFNNTQVGTTASSTSSSTAFANITVSSGVNKTEDEIINTFPIVRNARGASVTQPTYSHQVDSVWMEVTWQVAVPRRGTPVEGGTMASGVQVEVRELATATEGEDATTAHLTVVYTKDIEVAEGADALASKLAIFLQGGMTAEGDDALSSLAAQVYAKTTNLLSDDTFLGAAFAYTYNLSGVTRRANGNPIGACAVWVFRTADRLLLSESVSDASGNYSFALTSAPLTYFVRAHIDDDGTGARIFGTSDRNLVVTETLYYSAPMA